MLATTLYISSVYANNHNNTTQVSERPRHYSSV